MRHAWCTREQLADVGPDSAHEARREALAQAGAWLGSFPRGSRSSRRTQSELQPTAVAIARRPPSELFAPASGPCPGGPGHGLTTAPARAAVALGLRDGAGLPPACPSVFFCLLIQPGFRRSVGSVRRWVNSIGRSIRPFGGNSPTVIAYAVSGRAGDRRGRGYWGRDPVLTLRAARSVAVCLLASGRAAASLPWRCVGNRPIRPEAKAACHSPARALRRVAPLPPCGKGGSCESFPREY